MVQKIAGGALLLVVLFVCVPSASADDEEVGEFVSLDGRGGADPAKYKVFKDSQGSYYLKMADTRAKPQEGQKIKYKKADGTVVEVTQPEENNKGANLQLQNFGDALIAALIGNSPIVDVLAGDFVFPLQVPAAVEFAYATLDPPLFGDSGPFSNLGFFDIFVDLSLDSLAPMFVLGSQTSDGSTPRLFHFDPQESFILDAPFLSVIEDPNAIVPDVDSSGLLLTAVPEPSPSILFGFALVLAVALRCRRQRATSSVGRS